MALTEFQNAEVKFVDSLEARVEFLEQTLESLLEILVIGKYEREESFNRLEALVEEIRKK